MQDPPADLPPPPPPPPSERDPGADYLKTSPWTGLRFVGVLAAWLAGGLVGGIVAVAVGRDPSQDALGLAITVVAQAAAAAWVILRISRASGTGSLRRDVGLEFEGRDVVGILWGVGLQVGAALLISPLVQLLLDDFDTQQQVADVAEATGDVGGRLVLVAVFVLVAPFIEEVIFRGVMLGWLARHVSVRAAVVLSAAAFASVHLLDPNAVLAVPSLFVIGVVLGWAAQRRGSLSLPIFMHAGVNLLGAIFLMWGDEIVDYLERTQEQLESLAGLVSGLL